MKLRKILEAEQRDIISVTIPMLIKLMEWARETAESDVQVHELIEKLAARPGPLDTEVYDELVGDEPEYGEEPKHGEMTASPNAEITETKESAYDKGWDAGYGSYHDTLYKKTDRKCPYASNTPEREAWEHGYDVGRKERTDERSE